MPAAADWGGRPTPDAVKGGPGPSARADRRPLTAEGEGGGFLGRRQACADLSGLALGW